MSREVRQRVRVAWIVASIALCVATPVQARLAAPDPFAIPVAKGRPALGSGYDSELGAPRGEPGACVEDLGTEREEAPAVRYSLATLSRVGGRLVLGVHVAAVTATETLSSPRITDASRRLAQSDATAFRDLCGDGFVARVELGGHWMAELEVDRADVGRAIAGLTTGTWTEPEPFRAALESVTTRFRTTGRELPGGSRADAREIAPDALVEQALAFAGRVTSADEKAFLAVFSPYAKEAFSGIVLGTPGELDPREVAEQVFRDGRSAPGSTAASRAAEMRKAQVRREVPEEPLEIRPAARAPRVPDERETIVLVAPPPATASEPESAPPAAAAPRSAAPPDAVDPQVHKQAALVFQSEGGPPVYATTRAPGGVHAEQVRQRFYWVPGAATATAEVTRAIEAAKTGAPIRGTTIAIVELAEAVVVLTDAPPIAGVFSSPAGERRAWIAGVGAPDPSQRAALAAAIESEGASD